MAGLMNIAEKETRFSGIGGIEKKVFEELGAAGPISIKMLKKNPGKIYVFAGQATVIKTVEVHDMPEENISGIFGSYELRTTSDGIRLFSRQDDGWSVKKKTSDYFNYGSIFIVDKEKLKRLGYDL